MGVMLVLACGLGSWALYRQAGNRVPVLVAAHDVGRFETIERDDLRVVLVAAEPGAKTIPEGELSKIVGRVAVTELPQGSILSPGQVAQEGQHLVGEDEAVIGARLGPGAFPLGSMPPGTKVLVVVRPGGSDPDSQVREVPGWVAEVGERNPNNGSREASLVVAKSSAGDVAAAAAEERIAVVGLEG